MAKKKVEEITVAVEEPVVAEIIIEDDVLVEEHPVEVKPLFKIGTAIKIVPGAAYVSGIVVPDDILNSKLYVRQIRNGCYGVGTQMVGRILGYLKPDDVVEYTAPMKYAIQPYRVLVQIDELNVMSRPSLDSNVLTTLEKNCFMTVIDEKDGWGHLKIGGWIPLDKVLKP